ncbi:hypothetical protein TrST_g8366 [Triparma strigata]|uniref:Uncharacterized protein n=1 Tax=Triparma strigata TaxID=1606541 RepID=A0A9W6ZZF3_9STRA|nr:hypothetical protein TrST_g8366 [Triparma strigata]
MKAVTVVMLAASVAETVAYPSYLACSADLVVGGVGMNGLAISSTARTVSFSRDGTPLVCGTDTYVPGEVLTLSISSASNRYLFEVSGGALISGGSCSGRREDSNNLSVTMPSTGTVGAWAGWAEGSSAVVKISALCELDSGTLAPTAPPTTAPTPAPTVASTPSPLPAGFTASPTGQPTAELVPEPNVDGGFASRTAAGNLSILLVCGLSAYFL